MMYARPAIYRVFGREGELLYVGATENISRRLSQHRIVTPWWHLAAAAIEVQECETVEKARLLEGIAIAAECPWFNHHGTLMVKR